MQSKPNKKYTLTKPAVPAGFVYKLTICTVVNDLIDFKHFTE